MSTGETVTFAVVGFFVFLALLVFLRLLFRKGPPHWNQIRLGVYIERVPNPEWDEWEEEPPTIVTPPPPAPKVDKPPGKDL